MILNMTAGGEAGGKLTVTAPEGAVVTAAKDGKVRTGVAASGEAVFRGLDAGAWTVSCTDGVQTSLPQTVTVTTEYAASLTFFAATINVTYPAGSVCTATDGVTTLTAPDTSGTWECTVPNAGTWTVSCTDGTDNAEYPVGIDLDGQSVCVELSYGYILFYNGTEYVSWERTPFGEAKYVMHDPVISDGDVVLSTPGALHACTFGTSDAIDLSNYNTLLVNVTGVTVDKSNARFGITKNKNTTYAADIRINTSGAVGPTLLDISGFRGEYYVVLCSYATEGGGATNFRVNRVELIQ